MFSKFKSWVYPLKTGVIKEKVSKVKFSDTSNLLQLLSKIALFGKIIIFSFGIFLTWIIWFIEFINPLISFDWIS